MEQLIKEYIQLLSGMEDLEGFSDDLKERIRFF